MAEKVNLDALIPREDLEATTYVQRGRKKDTVSQIFYLIVFSY